MVGSASDVPGLDEHLKAPPDAAISEARQRKHLQTLGGVLENLNHLSSEADHLVATTHQSAVRNVRNAIIALACLGVLIIFAGAAIGTQQYKHVMRPLGSFREGVRTVASGGLSTRVPESGDREFLELAADFNAMAQELESLYRGLEEKVAIKSPELVQSERWPASDFSRRASRTR